MAVISDPAENAGNEPADTVERLLGRRLVVVIAEHQARAAAADLADRTDFGLAVGIVLAPDPDFIAPAGAARALDDQARRVVRQRVLMRAGFGHAVAALRHDAVGHQRGDDLARHRRAPDAEALR